MTVNVENKVLAFYSKFLEYLVTANNVRDFDGNSAMELYNQFFQVREHLRLKYFNLAILRSIFHSGKDFDGSQIMFYQICLDFFDRFRNPKARRLFDDLRDKLGFRQIYYRTSKPKRFSKKYYGPGAVTIVTTDIGNFLERLNVLESHGVVEVCDS